MLMLLFKCRQNEDENVKIYAERLLNLAEGVFPEGGRSVQRPLVSAFSDGLASDQLRLKVMGDNAATVHRAINTARVGRIYLKDQILEREETIFLFRKVAQTNGN